MTVQRTLLIIKPDSVSKGYAGKIIAILEQSGLKVIAITMKHLTLKEAQQFYAVHAERPFYNSLVDFMISGPCIPLVLEGENAIDANRKIMGVTNPKDAASGTIRALYGENIERNAVHGSDSEMTAKEEISFFFSKLDLIC
jgi:nucleoside-diphosphate kinase